MSINVRYEAIALNVTAVSGDTLDGWQVTFKDSSGAAYDISALDFYYTVKQDFDSSDTKALINKAPADAVKSDSGSGTVDTLSFPLTATDMELDAGSFVHAVKMANGAIERTWISGTFTVTQRRVDTV